MENIQTNETFERTKDRLIYHRAQLKADGRFAELLQLTTAMLERARALAAEFEQNDEAQVEAMAIRNRTDMVADKAIKVFELALQSLVMRNRKDPRYQMIFGPMGLSRMVHLPIIDEVVQIRRIVTLLDGSQFESVRNPHKVLLQEAADLLENAQKQLERAIQNQALSRAQLIVFREDVIRLFRANYGEIMNALPDNKDEVEAFFARFSHQNSKGEDKQPGPENNS